MGTVVHLGSQILESRGEQRYSRKDEYLRVIKLRNAIPKHYPAIRRLVTTTMAATRPLWVVVIADGTCIIYDNNLLAFREHRSIIDASVIVAFP